MLPDSECLVEVSTTVDTGFRDLWQAVIEDFFERSSPGGLRFSINDGGARPDVVTLRLMQGARLMEAAHMSSLLEPHDADWYEASARDRDCRSA